MTDKVFLLPAQIADIVFADLDAVSKKEIAGVQTAEGMIAFHHSAGQYVRNTFKLWDADNPHTMIPLRHCKSEQEAASSPFHPDQVSHEILKEVWRKVHNENAKIVMVHTGINAGSPFEGTFEGSHLVYPGTNDLMPQEPSENPDSGCATAERTFESELAELINRYSLEGESDTPDIILATYMKGALSTFTQAVRARDDWYGHKPWDNLNAPLEPLYTASEAPDVSS